MFEAGQALWHTVSRLIRLHWYYVTVQEELEGGLIKYEKMINDECQLKAVLNPKESSVEVIDVQVVTPAYMNGGVTWRMEPLTSVSLGEDKLGCVVCIIEVESGAVYHDSHRKNFDQTSLTNLREVYHSSHIRRT